MSASPLRATAPAMRTERAANPLAAAALGLVLLGCALRLVLLLGGRSPSSDEVLLALNLVHLPAARLTGELMLDQIAPVGWLLLQKLLVSATGDLDTALNVTAFAAGTGALLLFWRLAWRELEPGAAVLAVGFFAIVPPLVEYSAMAKPYAVDVFLSVAASLAAAEALRPGPRRLAWTLLLGVIGAGGIPFSFPVVVVLAAAGAILFARAALERDRRWMIALVAVGIAWMAVFALLHRGARETQADTVGNMLDWWSAAFAPLPPRSLSDLAWYPRALISFTGYLLGPVATWLAELLLLAGVVALARRRWTLALLLGPLAVAVLVSGLRAYPFGNRTSLYLAPQILLLLGAGIAWTAARFRPPLLAAAAISLVLAWPAIRYVGPRTVATPPWVRDEVKPNLALLARELRPGDALFVSPEAEGPLLLYGPRHGLGAQPYLVGGDYGAGRACAYADAAMVRRAGGRAWILLFHLVHRDVTDLFLTTLRTVGTLTLVGNQLGAPLYLFEPDPASPVVLPAGGAGCAGTGRWRPFLDVVATANRTGGRAALP